MAQSVIVLQNTSSTPQHVYFDDKRWTLYGLQTLPFPKEIAEVFLQERSKYVHKYVASPVPRIQGAMEVWMANVTGNPFLPETVKVWRKIKGEMTELEKPNPLRTPVPVIEYISGGQIIRQGEEAADDISVNLPKIKVELPPFTRLLVPAPYADRILERDGMGSDGWAGKVMLCREPSAFEPNETWAFDDVRLYAMLLDVDTFGSLVDPKSKNCMFKQENAYKDAKGAKQANLILELKHKLLDMVFFRLVDDRFAYPSKAEFDDYKQEMKEVKPSNPQSAQDA